MARSPHLSRNNFVKGVVALLGSIMGAAVGLPVIGYLISPALKKQETEAWIPAGPPEQYPIGTPTLFTFTRSTVNGWEKTVNSFGVFITRFSEDQASVRAFSNVCTHLSCRVNWKEAEELYSCPCHDAAFDIQGEIVHGPQPRPLDEYETKIEDGVLLIHLVGA